MLLAGIIIDVIGAIVAYFTWDFVDIDGGDGMNDGSMALMGAMLSATTLIIVFAIVFLIGIALIGISFLGDKNEIAETAIATAHLWVVFSYR